MKAVIMAGGRGTRISSVISDVPKPMIPVLGKPILEYQIDNLRACGVTDITLVIGYLGDVVRDHFGDGSSFGVKIDYFVEDSPLGTAGALFEMPELTEDFLLLCGDVILDVDFRRFIDFHRSKASWATLMSHPNGHPYDSSLLVTEILPPTERGGLPQDTHRVIQWLSKDSPRQYYRNCVNAGIEIISPHLLDRARNSNFFRSPDRSRKIDLDKDVLKPNLSSGRIFAYATSEYIKDMGTPDRLKEVEEDLLSGRVCARNMSRKQKAVFLDRDGTINKYVGFLTRPEEFELIPGAAEAIKRINHSEYLAIVVSNQPVIARGESSFEQLQEIHNKMETELGRAGAFLDAIYYCPHHPDKGFEGERSEYKIDCCCRKPKPGLLFRAAEEFNIDLSESILIGDDQRDLNAGKCAGLRSSILIRSNVNNGLFNVINDLLR